MVIQAEIEGIIQNGSRLEMSYAQSVDLDFKHLDIKQPVGSEILKKRYEIGEKITAQKERFWN